MKFAYFLVYALLVGNVFAASDFDFKVKGFYVGMPISNALTRINEEYSGIFSEQPVTLVKHANHYTISTDGMTLFNADDMGVVTSFIFPSTIVDKLFNVKDLDGQEFARMFMRRYQFDDFNPFTYREDPQVVGWRHIDPDGFRIEISRWKYVFVDACPKDSERMFD